MLFDIFLLRYFRITDAAAKSISFCKNRGLVNPCKSTSLEAQNVICINLLAYFRFIVLEFTLSPAERFTVFVMTPNEGLDCGAQSFFCLVAWFGIRLPKKAE